MLRESANGVLASFRPQRTEEDTQRSESLKGRFVRQVPF